MKNSGKILEFWQLSRISESSKHKMNDYEMETQRVYLWHWLKIKTYRSKFIEVRSQFI